MSHVPPPLSPSSLALLSVCSIRGRSDTRDGDARRRSRSTGAEVGCQGLGITISPTHQTPIRRRSARGKEEGRGDRHQPGVLLRPSAQGERGRERKRLRRHDFFCKRVKRPAGKASSLARRPSPLTATLALHGCCILSLSFSHSFASRVSAALLARDRGREGEELRGCGKRC